MDCGSAATGFTGWATGLLFGTDGIGWLPGVMAAGAICRPGIVPGLAGGAVTGRTGTAAGLAFGDAAIALPLWLISTGRATEIAAGRLTGCRITGLAGATAAGAAA